ncbi:MAG: PIN domain-containing protein [Saprospiraceae bacterium]|nr:PIN domain-containing protein [Saprospiraceae bacterium]
MNGDYLLDTNIVIALLAEEQAVLHKVNQATTVFIPAIIIGELYYGAYNSSKKEENEAKINAFGSSSNVIDCDIFTAAMQYDLTLVSRDAHFGHIDGLK